MASTEGHLVMADISGYTAFVSGTEHEHSREILAELIENLRQELRREARHRSGGGALTDALTFPIGPTDVVVVIT